MDGRPSQIWIVRKSKVESMSWKKIQGVEEIHFCSRIGLGRKHKNQT